MPFDRCFPCGPCGRAAEGSLSVGDRLRNAAIVGDPVAFAKVLHVLSSHPGRTPVKCKKFFDDVSMRDRRGNASERKQGGETALHWAAWSGNDLIVTMTAERALHMAQLGSSLDDEFKHEYTFKHAKPKHEKDYCDAARNRRDLMVQNVKQRFEDEERIKQAMLAMLPKRSQERKLKDAEKFAMARLALARASEPGHAVRTALSGPLHRLVRRPHRADQAWHQADAAPQSTCHLDGLRVSAGIHHRRQRLGKRQHEPRRRKDPLQQSERLRRLHVPQRAVRR